MQASVNFVGQKNLIQKLDDLNQQSIPHAILLVGEDGCGKKTFSQLLAEKLNLRFYPIQDKIELNLINSIYNEVAPTLYLIEGSSITPKEEAVLLKILEEPPDRAYFIITSINTSYILSTILNRCQIWTFEEYSLGELVGFSKTGLVSKYAKTPGQVIKWEFAPFKDMEDYVDLILDHVASANLANTLTIPNKIAFKDEQGKFPVDLFIEILYNKIKERVLKGDIGVQIYSLILSVKQRVNIPHIDKKLLIENFLLELKEGLR